MYPFFPLSFPRFAPAVLSLLVGFLFLTPSAYAQGAPSCLGGVSSNEARQLASMRQAGLSGDKSQIASLRSIIRDPYATNTHTFGRSLNEALVVSALRALTRLNAIEAIPDVDQLVKQVQVNYPDLANFAIVQKARLEAEKEADQPFSAQMGAFYKALNLTPDAINKGAEEYKQKYFATLEGRRLPVLVEVYAVREIADMMYRGNNADDAKLLEVSQVDFHNDYPASLKMRLAAVPPAQRMDVMLQELAHRDKWEEDENYEIQLAADEEPEVSQAVADQIAFMSVHRTSFPEYGFKLLFQVLECLGRKEQAKLLMPFLNDKDGGVAQAAQSAYYYSVWGLQRQRAIGY